VEQLAEVVGRLQLLTHVACLVLHAGLQPSRTEDFHMSSMTAKEATTPANAAEGPLPTGIELTPLDATFRDDPYPVLKRLRNVERVHRDTALARWFVTGFDEVRELLRSRDMAKDLRKADTQSYSGRTFTNGNEVGAGALFSSMLFMDDPHHRRLRALVSKPFSLKAIEDLRPRVRALAEELTDEISAERFDLIDAFAAPFPVLIIGDMLGVEPHRRAQFKEWSEQTVAGLFNPLNATAQERALTRHSQQQLDGYLTALINARRREPRDDLISSMIASAEDEQPMSDAEILGQSKLLLVAGNITTTDLIANSMKALLTHPDQLAALRAQPELIGNAVEEVLRYDSPVTQASRVADANLSFHGCPMHRGESVFVSLAAANHDPRANPDPERFDIRRRDIRHQSFGGGNHMCLGAALARLEAQEGIRALLQQFPNLSLAGREFRYKATPSFRSLQELWVSTRAATTMR
jgi:cytochrome P450